MAALLGLVDVDQNRAFFERYRPCLLVHRQHPASQQFAGEDLVADAWLNAPLSANLRSTDKVTMVLPDQCASNTGPFAGRSRGRLEK
jgi:hypothetical protein